MPPKTAQSILPGIKEIGEILIGEIKLAMTEQGTGQLLEEGMTGEEQIGEISGMATEIREAIMSVGLPGPEEIISISAIITISISMHSATPS
jgi:hypothetical protein